MYWSYQLVQSFTKNHLIRKIRLITKYIIIIFKKISIANNFLRPMSAHLRNRQRGTEVFLRKNCSIWGASKLRNDSLYSNLQAWSSEHKSCLSTYTSKAHIDRHLKRKLGSESFSRDLLSLKRKWPSEVPKFKRLLLCLFCGEEYNLHLQIQSILISGDNQASVGHLIEEKES